MVGLEGPGQLLLSRLEVSTSKRCQPALAPRFCCWRRLLTCCWKRAETGNLEGPGGLALWSTGCRVGSGVVAGAAELSTTVPWLFAILESLFVAVELGHLA